MNMRKGISPLIASVLLLAVTLSVASIFSGWGPQLIRDVTQRTGNQTTQTMNCNQAGVSIESAKYYAGENTTVVVRNTGNSELQNLQVSAWRNNLPMNKTSLSLGSGNFTSVNVSTTSEPSHVEAYSRDCSSVTASYDQISQ